MIHADWATAGFTLPPMAPHTGVFPTRDFLHTWWTHRAGPDDELLLVETDSALLPVMRSGELITFIGEPDLTDYHSPLGNGLDPLVAELATAASGTRFRFDSLPAPAAETLANALTQLGDEVRTARHDVAAVLTLPKTFSDYLGGLSRKERHETRRKRRRFTESQGEPTLRRLTGPDAVADFAVLHTKASGDKGAFLTAPLQSFFQGLHDDAGAVIDVVTGANQRPVAAAFGFEDDNGYYLYNLAYDPAVGGASPGVVLVSMLIEQAINLRRSVFDFLKGNEAYKFRLGAQERPLFVVTGRLR